MREACVTFSTVLSVVSAQIRCHFCLSVLSELRETGVDWGLESRLGARTGWDWGPESRAEGPDWDWSPGCLPRLGWTGGWSPWPEARTEAGVLSGAQDSGTQFGTVCGLGTQQLARSYLATYRWTHDARASAHKP